MTDIKVGDKDSALIIRADGSIESVLPHYDGDEQVAIKDVLISAISARLVSDPKFADQQIEWLNRQVAKSRMGKRKKHQKHKQLELPGLEGQDVEVG